MPKPKIKTPGEQIRDARESAGLTQHQLVDAVNRRRGKGAPQFRQAHLSAMENNHHPPTLALLEEIAAACGCRLSDKMFVKIKKGK